MDQPQTHSDRTRTASREASLKIFEHRRFRTRFPALPDQRTDLPRTDLPRTTWDHLQRQLTALSSCAPDEVEAMLRPIRDAQAGKPPEMVLRELLIAASILLDEAPPAPRPSGQLAREAGP